MEDLMEEHHKKWARQLCKMNGHVYREHERIGIVPFEAGWRAAEESMKRLLALGLWAEKHAVPALIAAQERLETGSEVNRSASEAPRVTATSVQIREALDALPGGK